METGDGIDHDTEGFVMLSWSDDNGRNWGNERRVSLGKKGEYKPVQSLHRLGQCGPSGRSFRVRVSDPVKRAIAGMAAQVEQVPL